MKLPVVSGYKVIKSLQKIEFRAVGRKGSHVRLKKKTPKGVWIITVPLHKELAIGTLKSIIKRSGLTREEFLEVISK